MRHTVRALASPAGIAIPLEVFNTSARKAGWNAIISLALLTATNANKIKHVLA